MSDCSSQCEASPSGEEEPTMVSVPIVGSSITDEMANSWDASNHESNTLVSPLNNYSPVDPSVSLASATQIPSAISQTDIMTRDARTPTSFIHAAMIHRVDSTSVSLGICEDEQMLVDRPLQSVTTIVSHESMSVSHDSENSDEEEDHLTVMDNITAQNFLRETDLLNAATSVLNAEKSPISEHIIGKSNIHHNLISSLDHHSVSTSHDSEPMDMQNLLQDHSDLDGQVPSMPGYHLDHSQTSDLSCVNSSDLHIISHSNSVPELRSDNMCFDSSSEGNTSDLSPGTISSGVGLPPVSTIIRSSVAKGRFDAFCHPSNINMLMDLPPFLNSSGSYDAMVSMGAIQRIGTDHCDLNVSLTSPLDVPSRNIPCTDIDLESVDVPLSTVCSTTCSDLISVVGSRCIKPISSVMSTLGPDILGKHSPSLSELAESQMQSNENLNLPLTSTSSIPPFPGVIPIRDIINLAGSSQVSLLSSMRLEDIQKFAAIRDHLRAENNSDESLSQSIIASHFNCRDDINQSDAFSEELSHSQQPLPLLSVSAIETNVIMSTSNAGSASKLSNSDIKIIEASKGLTDQQLQNLEAITQQLENSEIEVQVCNKNLNSSRTPNIVFSTMQNVISGQSNSASVFTTSSTISPQNIASRSSIIERNVAQHPSLAKREDLSISSVANKTIISDGTTASLLQSKDEQTPPVKSQKLDDRFPLTNRQHITTVSPVVTASVIQQLLKAQVPNIELKPTLQRVSGGVITSVTSAKSGFATVPVQKIQKPVVKSDEESDDDDDDDDYENSDELSDELPASTETPQRALFISVGGTDKLLRINDESIEIARDKTPDFPVTLDFGKDVSVLPNLSAVALPSFFSNLSASALASLQSSLKSSIPVTLPTSLPTITLAGTATSAAVSLLSSLQNSSSAVPSIILPNILSSTLRSNASGGKSADGLPSTTLSSSNYSGLLKSVGLSTIVKQESELDGSSGPLPPFTVVSGLPPLVKREFSANLANSFLNSTSASSQIPVLTIKQEPCSKQASASASDFTASSILNASSTLPNVGTVQIPSTTSLELSVVVACSTAATTMPTSPVPSQASAITFAGNALAIVSSAATTAVASAASAKQDESSEKKWNCTMCKNGSPCGLHPIQSQGSSTSSQGVAPPPPRLSGDPAKPFQCTLCGKHLASKNVYQLHLRSHSGEKPFTCNLCGHHFSQKTSLTRHMRSHTGERPFPCEACGKRFADKERIKIHMRTHTGEKPFACEVCGKRFSQKSTVKRHMSVHTGEKPFKCDTCGKGFANRGNLNAHSKTHANT